MPVSRNTPVSEEPPTVAVAVDKEAFTHHCLEHVPEATINVPPDNLLDVVYRMGSVSGREIDKVKEFNLHLKPSKHVRPPIWSDGIASLEARVYKKVDVGEVTLYVFEVVEAYVDLNVYTRWGFDFRKINILFPGAGRTFYRVGRYVRAAKT
jgi:flavin reductase (DIM6/NTAB) family NADH-FMN oxidoreductase RutF